MNFLELAKERFSVRKFNDVSIAQEDIDKILEAGYIAPTACNLQPQQILVINSKEGLENFRKCTECHFNAPLAFVISYDKQKCWTRSYDGKSSGEIDASIVAAQMMLEATELGIGYPIEGTSPAAEHSKTKEVIEMVTYNSYKRR